MSHIWSMAEDVQLCISYCRQSTDPVFGNKQKIDKLWAKIHSDFHESWIREGNPPRADPRSQVALSSRLSKLKPNLVFWGTCLAFARRNPESGGNVQDEIRKAQTMYVAKKKKEFMHFPCWEHVKDHQTFSTTVTSTPPTYHYIDEHLTDEFPTTVEPTPTPEMVYETDFSTPETQHESPASPTRPMGVKASKDARRKGKQIANTTLKRDAALDKMAKTQEAMMIYQQKQDEKEERKYEKMAKTQDEYLRLKKLEEETKIMQIDTQTMTPVSKRYFSKRKADILKSYEAQDAQDAQESGGQFSGCYRPLHFDD